MASNPLRMLNNSGRDIDILGGAATGEPVSRRTVLPSFNAIHTNTPERRGVGPPLPPWQPRDMSLRLHQRSPALHGSPIQLPPLSDQRSSAPEMRRTDWDLSCGNSVADYAQDPFSAPDIHGPLRGINAVDPASPSIPRDVLPEYYLPSRNASFSSMGPGSMYPDPTQVEPRSRQFDGYAKPPQAPLPRLLWTLPAPHGVPMHARHYHGQHYAASQGHMVPQIPAFPPPPATTVIASGTKRYQCCYASFIGCERTFTTSGHASRHSKIHICEKGIQCAFASCPKKFTRADNMKQHLKTHFKDSRRPRPPRPARAPAPAARYARTPAHRLAKWREGRRLTCDIVRLQARQMQEVNIKEGNEAFA